MILVPILVLLAAVRGGDNLTHGELRLTTEAHADDSDLDAACAGEHGEGARLADWNDIETIPEAELETLLEDMGVAATQNKKAYWVKFNGEEKFGPQRHYFVERHDGAAPENWLVHAQHGDLTGVVGNGVISLGSWYGFESQVLCLIPNGEPHPNQAKIGAEHFQLTEDAIFVDKSTGDLDGACRELGNKWGIADWDDLAELPAYELQVLLANLGIPVSESSNFYFVTKGGKSLYDKNRSYFFERHDGPAPDDWKSKKEGQGQLGKKASGVITLAAWRGISGRVLCKSGPAKPTPPASNCHDKTSSRTCKLLGSGCRWIKKRTLCIDHVDPTCATFNDRGKKCPLRAKKWGLTCYQDVENKLCVETPPVGNECHTFKSRKKCRKAHRGCKYKNRKKKCVDK